MRFPFATSRRPASRRFHPSRRAPSGSRRSLRTRRQSGFDVSRSLASAIVAGDRSGDPVAEFVDIDRPVEFLLVDRSPEAPLSAIAVIPRSSTAVSIAVRLMASPACSVSTPEKLLNARSSILYAPTAAISMVVLRSI
ncbi:hypothetical protein BRC68_10010 [Halobacteriales archaeon QH_6_64_20]|nr:MAG: hypothetical protein BRC68_10010 [Halobacteriales archaeon QH_6_64_20]